MLLEHFRSWQILSVQTIPVQKYYKLLKLQDTREGIQGLPAAAVGDFVTVTVKKGPAELRKQIFGAVIVRQKYPIRRLNGVRVSFEDNAAVLVTTEGEIKGTDLKGPVAAEAAEKWPRIANLASMII